MIKIYFDDVLIDVDNYASITNDFKLFDDEFMLGTTVSNSFTIEVPKSVVSSIPTTVKITIDDNDYAVLIVDKYEILDNDILSLTVTDKMVLLNFNYDASSIVPCTTKTILENICLKAGIELGTNEFINDDIEVNYYDNTILARDYVSFIAELNGGYAIIGQDGKLYLKNFDSNPVIINTDDCEDFTIGQYHKIERVVFDNGLLKYETSEDETLETLYLHSDNVYITDQEVFNNIANKILNFEFYCFETGNCKIDSNVIAGDLIAFFDGTNTYQTIAQYSLDYNGDWIGGYSLDINSKHQEETKQTGLETQIKKLQVNLKRNENELSIIAEDTKTIEDKLTNDFYTKEQSNELILNSESGLTNIFKSVGGNNLLKNSALYFKSNDTYDYWTGSAEKIIYSEAQSNTAIKLKKDTFKQNVSLANGDYTLSFKYERLNELGTASVKINNEETNLDEKGTFTNTLTIETNQLELEFNSTVEDSYIIYDLMLNIGKEASTWSQYQNEVHTGTVNISKGIEVEATENDTKATMNADGFNVINKNTSAKVLKATDTGIETTDIKADKGTIGGMSVKKVQNQSWIVGV